MISFCLLNETLSGMYGGVRDGNLRAIGSNAWDTTKTVGRGIATGAKAVGSGLNTAGQHVARNKELYGYGGLLAAGLGSGAYLYSKGREASDFVDNSISAENIG